MKEEIAMKTPFQIVKAVYNRLYYYCCPDKIYLNNKFKQVFGRDIDWKNPTTFNEKLQWLKIYDRNPLYTKLVDKYEVRKYVAEKIGEEYLIPCLGVWNKVEDIDFDKLPNQFVLKCTHDSHSIVICKDKCTFDVEGAKRSLKTHLKRNFYYNAREWPYKHVKPRIIAEKYMSDESGSLPDYKIHSFNGTPKVILVCRNRFQDGLMTEDFYSETWERLDVKRPEVSNSIEVEPCPPALETMLSLTRELSKEFQFIRTDFYTIQNKLYFGELTFYPSSGFVAFEPEKYDKLFGDWMKIPVPGGGISSQG